MMDWQWSENSILNKYSEYTPCKDIFQAVCDEVGKYYEGKGLMYSKSRPKIAYKDKYIKLEIGLWSSGYNIPGKYVQLEIVPSIFSLELAKSEAEKDKKFKGYIFGYPDIFLCSLPDKKPGTVIIKQILDEDIELFEESNTESVLKMGHTCNIYGITVDKFVKILDFIDGKIMPYIGIFTETGKLEKFIESSDMRRIRFLNSPKIKKYIEITFLNEKNMLLNRLENKVNTLIGNDNVK